MITGTSLTHHTTHSHFHDEIDEGPATPGDDDDDDDDKDKVSLFSKEHFQKCKLKFWSNTYFQPCKIYKIDKTDVWPSITKDSFPMNITCSRTRVTNEQSYFGLLSSIRQIERLHQRAKRGQN